MAEWKTNRPPVDGAYKVITSDYMGEFEYIAEYVRYKNDRKGSGRWMQRDEYKNLVRVQRKEYPEKWRTLTRDEFMNYYGLGEEDMQNDN